MQPIAVPDIHVSGLLPLIVLLGGALFILLADAFVPPLRRQLGGLSLILIVLSAVLVGLRLGMPSSEPVPGMYGADVFAHAFDLIALLAAAGAVGLSLGWRREVDRGEYWALILFAAAGMMALVHAINLVTVFLALETLSVVLYVLTGFQHERERSAEAALKYFFLGSFSSGFLLFGMALVYGTTGTFELAAIVEQVRTAMLTGGGHAPLLLLVGTGLLLTGFAFKISSVPFHMWTPDVYQGAPTPIAAFMSVGTKAAAFGALLRVMTGSLAPLGQDWRPLLAAIAVLTMLVGNLIALTQRNLKRLLAFSSVAHAGYALIGVVCWDHGGRAATLYYLLVYAFMNLGAFGMVAALERDNDEDLNTHDLAGLSRRRPFAAALMALFLLSLAGVPPTAGFVGKLYLILAAVEASWIKLAILTAIYSVIAAYVYLRVIVIMYAHPAPRTEAGLRERIPLAAAVVLALAGLGTLVLGVAPALFYGIAERAAAVL